MRKYRCKRCGMKGQATRWSKVFKGFVCVDRKECTEFLELGSDKEKKSSINEKGSGK